MVWDLETMERNNENASYNYVDRNRDIIDAAVTHVLNTVMKQVDIALQTVNIETADALMRVRDQVRKELKEKEQKSDE